MNDVKKLLLLLLCIAMTAQLFAGCGEQESSEPQETTVQATTQPPVIVPKPAATIDTAANVTHYDYLSIKQKTADITSDFDGYVAERRFKGVIYAKLGNDFEYLSATGASDTIKRRNNSINTRYRVGSLTKQMTAAAVLILADSGKLKVTDTIDRYFPDYEYGGDITIDDLLNMTSGIPNYIVRSDISNYAAYLHIAFSDDIKEDNSAKENKEIILDWILSQELHFEPSTAFEFSDSNYYLLGEIIAQASGESYEDFITTALFKPLSMNATSFEPDDDLAVPYDGNEEGALLYRDGVGYAACGVISSISDLLKWADGIFYDKLLSDEAINKMRAEGKFGYSCGMYISGDRLSASGRCGAYSSTLSYTTDKNEIYISLSNYNYSDPSYLRGLFRRYLSRYASKTSPF